jgi:hypothetical protein
VLIVAGIQLLAIGLLGELQVRHYYTSQHPLPTPSTASCAWLRAEEQSLLSEGREDRF